ncbi:MAG: hypothetical protein HOV86_00210 [Thermoactinospora sp.]|nr:hypothetical protein [Thermoactinospora sp.]
MVEAPIASLYRQLVDEKVRRVRLDDGSEITLTRRHKLLGVDGWTNEIAVGDRVCVPDRLLWSGEALDPDLVTVLAWQIAEGHEPRHGCVNISQKDTAVLARVAGCAHRFSARSGVPFNRPSIVRPKNAERTPYLRISSVAYADFLESLGYRFGSVSAHKRIPDRVVAADTDSIRLFLREYFTAEAHVGDGVVEVCSASARLMHQLACMLRRLGIRMRVKVKSKYAANGTRIRRDYRYGYIGGPHLRRFLEAVGFSDERKQAKLEVLCARTSNSNTDGIPGHDLLRAAESSTGLPQRHFGVGTVYFAGSQELSRTSARSAVAHMDRILSGVAAADYATRPRTRWTDRVLAAYAGLDHGRLRDVRDTLHVRSEREVYYAKVVSVEEFDYRGHVYDFEVPDHHNFVAAGMLCHNTVQALSLLVHESSDKPTLLVCPMSLLGNWESEAARFAPGLRVHVHHGASRDPARLTGADLVITTYGTAQRDLDTLKQVAWRRVVCDEAQAIKNSGTLQAQAVRSITAETRLALTGTPVENHLAELWSIMEFCNPGLLGSKQRFRTRFQEPIEARQDAQAEQALKRATGPFVLRRLKTDKSIISDLPEKLEVKEWCTLTPEQASLYQAVVDDMMGKIDGSEGIERRGLVLAAMAKLKQVCNHPAHLLKDGSRLAGRSGKLARTEELAAEILAEGEKGLLFTQYSEYGSMLQPYLAQRLDRPVLWLHGGLPKKTRDRLVERFQHDDEPMLFLLSLKAAGVGLNLTAANHVIHLDRWWNPAVEDQATDRAFRIGQRKNVQVRKLICAGTLEERIDEMIERKKALAERVVGTGEDWLTDLSTAELREVFRLGAGAVA